MDGSVEPNMTNGVDGNITNAPLFRDLAAGELSEEQLAEWIGGNCAPLPGD